MGKKSEKIVNSTIKLFIENGVKKTTMDEIAGRANVSKVTIYKYFGDKDSFYLEISKKIFTHYANALDSIDNSDNRLDEKLFVCMDILMDFTNSGKYDLCYELSMYNDNIEKEYILYQKKYRETLNNLIDQGKGIGIIRKDVDTDKVYYYIDMGIAYYQNNLEYRKKMQHDIKFQKEFMEFFIKNIFIDIQGLI